MQNEHENTPDRIVIGRTFLEALGLSTEDHIVKISIDVVPMELPTVTVVNIFVDEDDKVVLEEDGTRIKYAVRRFAVVDIHPLLKALELVEVE